MMKCLKQDLTFYGWVKEIFLEYKHSIQKWFCIAFILVTLNSKKQLDTTSPFSTNNFINSWW